MNVPKKSDDTKGLWTTNIGESQAQNFEQWTDPPPGGFWAKWGGGIIGPLAMLWWGIHAIVTRTATLYDFLYGGLGDRLGRIKLQETNALLFGCALISLAFFFHAHYFWGNSKRLINISALGKILGLAGFSISALWLVFRLYKEAFTI